MMVEPPIPFKSDGCTWAPDFNFRDECVEHDHDYWRGGSKADRLKADLKFRKGVRAKGHPVLAEIYFRFVRVFGTPHRKAKRKWGVRRMRPSTWKCRLPGAIAIP